MAREAHAPDDGRPAPVPDTIIVVPCYNEAERLDLPTFIRYCADAPSVRFLFVDDGSTDRTRAMLQELCRDHPESFELLAFDDNRGKAEAVRLGILVAARRGCSCVGFWDADLATPLDEIVRLRAIFDERPEVEIVFGSRVNLLGRDVHRKLTRHYVGRVFATAVAAALRLPVYDTQCGAKLYRCTEDTIALFREPFFSKWIFDAEILTRAIDVRGVGGSREISRIAFELPLLRWEDVEGSKIRWRHLAGTARDAFRIYSRHVVIGRWRRGSRGHGARAAALTRDTLARLSTDRQDVGVLNRLVRSLLLVPVFGALLVLTRVRAWLIGPLEMQTTTRSGSRFRCRLPDFVQTYLYLFGVWEPDVTAFLRRRLQPGDTFVDVGANIGYHTLLAQQAVGEEGRVVAIEASPTIGERLERSLEINDAPASVRTVHCAVADRSGHLTMYGGPVNNVGLSTSLPSRGFSAEARVPCAPLADLLEPSELKTVKVVKIDVEGGEDAVLRGMVSSLDALPHDVEILVELSPKWWSDPAQTPRQVLQPFLDAGFHVYAIDNNLWPWRYLWPNDVRAPRRMRHARLAKRPKRIDVVLSKVDADSL